MDIHYAEEDRDLEGFRSFLRRPRRALAVDTETTGLDIFTPDFRVRLVQFGDTSEAWVLDPDRFPGAIREALAQDAPLVAHNATFDLLILDRFGLAPAEASFPRTTDTSILAHLLDPRERGEGGTGRKLKDLASVYVASDAPDSDVALKRIFRENRWKVAEGYARIPVDHEDFIRYAGLDVILTARLLEALGPLCLARGFGHLVKFEHALQALLARLERRGFLVDVPYTEGLLEHYDVESREWASHAARHGVGSVNSTAQVIAALQAMGEDLTETTETGNLSVAKEVLMPLADLDSDWDRVGLREPNPLAEAVLHAKRAGKYRKSYAQAMLDLRDVHDRIHPKINGLQARTARMSVARPPLQQLPSGGQDPWRVRRSLVADPGKVIIACDYAQVEMRVLAALAQERKMMAAIAEGTSLHVVTATLMFGPDYTKGQYKLAKNTGFGEVFGGGATTLARQAGVPLDVAKAAKSSYSRAFPGIKRFGRRLVDRAKSTGDRNVTTPSGRVLPLDGDRLYAATNYIVQSTARDVLGQALLDLEEAGLSKYLLLPVHDEVIGQADEGEAKEVSEAIREVMTMDFHGVRLDAEAEVYGKSWGHGYGAPEETS